MVLDKQGTGEELNAKDNSVLRQVNGYVSLLEPKCKSGRYTLEEMKELIADSFKN